MECLRKSLGLGGLGPLDATRNGGCHKCLPKDFRHSQKPCPCRADISPCEHACGEKDAAILYLCSLVQSLLSKVACFCIRLQALDACQICIDELERVLSLCQFSRFPSPWKTRGAVGSGLGRRLSRRAREEADVGHADADTGLRRDVWRLPGWRSFSQKRPSCLELSDWCDTFTGRSAHASLPPCSSLFSQERRTDGRGNVLPSSPL